MDILDFFQLFKMFTKYSCYLKGNKVEKVYFLIYGCKKLRGIFLPLGTAKMIFSTTKIIHPNFLTLFEKS